MVLADGLAGGGFMLAVGICGAMTESACWFVIDTCMGTELDVLPSGGLRLRLGALAADRSLGSGLRAERRARLRSGAGRLS